VSAQAAVREYGVVVDGTQLDEAATAAERERQRASRGELPTFDFGHAPVEVRT
jgi:hypothetical protein